MQKNKFVKDLSHYMPLMGVLGFGFVGFFAFSYDKSFQVAVIIATALGYVSWGIIHHSLHKDLMPSVIWEYVSFALLGLVLTLSVFYS